MAAAGAAGSRWPPPSPDVGPLVGAAVRLVAAAVVLTGLLIGTGLVLASSTGVDSRVERWLAHHRSGSFNTLTDVVSHLGSTPGIIAVATVTFIVLRLWLRRWHESLVVVVTIVGELGIFLTVTAVVERHRPDVHQLDAAPPTSSFPSGHTAAATALYLLIGYLALRYAKRTSLGVLVAVLCLLVPVGVALSRLYRGMHFPTDVLGGMTCGGAWLLAVLVVLMPPAWSALRDRPAEYSA